MSLLVWVWTMSLDWSDAERNARVAGFWTVRSQLRSHGLEVIPSTVQVCASSEGTTPYADPLHLSSGLHLAHPHARLTRSQAFLPLTWDLSKLGGRNSNMLNQRLRSSCRPKDVWGRDLSPLEPGAAEGVHRDSMGPWDLRWIFGKDHCKEVERLEPPNGGHVSVISQRSWFLHRIYLVGSSMGSKVWSLCGWKKRQSKEIIDIGLWWMPFPHQVPTSWGQAHYMGWKDKHTWQ